MPINLLMKFFNAGDVLDDAVNSPKDPITIDFNDTASDALEIMIRNDFDQLPVEKKGDIIGSITYKSISKALSSVERSSIEELNVSMAVTESKFVDKEENIFGLFDYFAENEFVLVGDEHDLEGIITRYDVFLFLKDQMEPFIQIGSIERNIRDLIKTNIEDIDECIEDTFETRANQDDAFSIPENVDRFSFKHYHHFLRSNQEEFSEIENDIGNVLKLIENVGEERNALFHFRQSSDELDREKIDVAKNYFERIS